MVLERVKRRGYLDSCPKQVGIYIYSNEHYREGQTASRRIIIIGVLPHQKLTKLCQAQHEEQRLLSTHSELIDRY